MQGKQIKYHKLPHDGLAKVLGAGICAQSDEEATVDVFETHALLSLLLACQPITFQPAGFSLLLGLTSNLWLGFSFDVLFAVRQTQE